jgi:hypothetical protein
MTVASTAQPVRALIDPFEYRAAYSDDGAVIEDASETFRTLAEAQTNLAHVNEYTDPPFFTGGVERRLKAAGWERVA